jgi:tetratricopeptide (TPR) repeat protein/type II secretory pathway predicted ATPase ExeA
VPNDNLFSSSRFSVSERRAALVGRAAELRELERAYAASRDEKQAHTVTLLGATGIGKTRLVRDFLVHARESGLAPRVFRGTAREGGPAYEVFARVLRARFGIVEGMDAEAAKGQVRAQVAAVLEDRKVGDVAYFLGQLLELKFQDSPLIKAVEGDVQQMRSMRRAVIKSFLEADAAKGAEPLVLVFDDLQWAHDDALQLLAYLVGSLRGPIVVVCMSRPELLARHDGWRRHGERHAVIELGPLGDADAAAILTDLLAPCGEAAGVADLVDEAVLLGGGNPALLEQIVRVYHDAGVLEVADDFGDERWIVHPDKLSQVKVPLSVQDAVQARIAALAPVERELLERAATMGGVFWLGGLVAIHRQAAQPPEAWEGGEAEDVVRIRNRLGELVERDYVLRLPDSTFSGDEEYVFKHNLEREALVRLTSPAGARRYHKAISEWLAFRESADGSEEYLEMLARHRDKAGAAALAAVAYVQAGDVARSRYANSKAAELYGKALALLEVCDPADEDLRLKALQHSGDALQALGRCEEARRGFVEMRARAWRLDLRSKGGAAHSRIGRLDRDMGRLEEAARQLTAALALFGQARDERGIASTLDDIGKLHWLKGDHSLALEYTLRSLAIRRKVGDRRSIALSLNNLGLVHQDAGNMKGAVDAFEQSLRIRREIGDLVGASMTLNNLGTVAQDMHDDRKAFACFQEAYEIAKDTGDRNRIALVLTNLGETHSRLGDSAKAVGLLKQAEELADELGDKAGLAEAVRALGRAYLGRREYPKALECMQRAARLFAETQSKVQLGVVLRSLGETTAAAAASVPGGGSDASGLREAADCLKQSIAIFEEIGNEVELARSCRAYSEILRTAPEHAKTPSMTTEAAVLSKRAEEILGRLRALAATSDRDDG